MKRIVTLLVLAMAASVCFAQPLCKLTGIPVPRKTFEPIKGAVVTLINEWDKDLKYIRKVDAEGFQMIVPQGGYLLKIEAEGYEPFRMEIDLDAPTIDLDVITMQTEAEAAARLAKQKKRAKRGWE